MQRRSSPQDISWFLDLRNNEQLDMDPPYQRRSVWNAKDRRFFLDTVFRGYPCPPIFLHKNMGPGKTVYAVVDGKQRLQTLFLFVDGQIQLAEDFDDERFKGKTWQQLGQDERKAFWDYVIPVEFLTFDVNDTKAVSQAFDRLNRNMRKLESQELRHARWDGWFIQFVEKECDASEWKTLGVVTNARAKRMKDAQFLSELLLVIIEEQQIGFDQSVLDAAYAQYDDIEEADDSIDPDEIKLKLEETKEFLLEAERTNGSIKPSGKSLAHFYTLWSLVVLHRDDLPEAPQFAERYQSFMNKFDEMKDAPDPQPFLAGDNADDYRCVYDYLQGYGGASTDIAPRTRRLNALRDFMRNE